MQQYIHRILDTLVGDIVNFIYAVAFYQQPFWSSFWK